MGEPKFSRMQRLTMKLQLLQNLAVRLAGTPVDRIADQRMADGGHVDPYLVGPPGFEPALDECRVLQGFKPPPVRHCALAAMALHDRNLLAVRRRASERRINAASARFRNSVDDRQ